MKRAMATMLCMAIFFSGSLSVSATGVSDATEVQPVSVTEEIIEDEVQENVLDQDEISDEVQEDNEISEAPDEIHTDAAEETDTEISEESEDTMVPEETDTEISEEPEDTMVPEESEGEVSEEPGETMEIPVESEEDTGKELEKTSEEGEEPEGEKLAEDAVAVEEPESETKMDAETADISEETNTDQEDISDVPVSEEVKVEESVEMETVAAYDTIATAKSISMGSRQNGTISATNEKDHYKFTLDKSSCVNIKGTYAIYRVYLRLFDATGKELWSSAPYWNSTTERISQDDTFYLTSGTYYYCVERRWSDYGVYDFTVTSVSSNESFTEEQGGSNNSMEAAKYIDRGRSYKGQLSMNDNKDFYAFTLAESGCVTLKGTYNLESVWMRIYDEAGNEVWSSHPWWNSTTKRIVQDEKLNLTSGKYYYCVDRYYERYGTYDFAWTFTSANESFSEVQGGNNNNIGSANEIKVATTYKGQIALNDGTDFYRVVMPKNGKYLLSLTAYMEWIHIYLYDKDGKEIYHRDPHWTSTKSQISFQEAFTLSAGTYYLAFTRNSRCNGNYQFQFGNPVQVGWQQQGGYWYYNDDNGVRQTGWQEIDGDWYYMSAVGVMQTGWTKVGSTWYYLGGNGARRTGWQKVSGKWYYLNSRGEMQTGWTQVGRSWYCLNSKGEMQTGWKKINGKWYCMNSKGVMQTGWTKVGGKWYYMNSNGVMQTGWTKVGRSWYCLNSSGVMQTGWHRISGKWYCMSNSGEMQTGWTKVGGKWYYMNSSGVMQTGWVKISGKWYYMNQNGVWTATR